MNTRDIKALNNQFLINTYGERKHAFIRGAGSRLWDAEEKEYLDFFAGIAVVNLGHCHPAVTEAICSQARTLVHVSNLYYIEPQVRLAELLSVHSFADRWFFANCGATANEAAIKLARRYWAEQGTPKPHIITALDSFHGRTLATITATGQPKYHAGFEPMAPGFSYVPYDDVAALDAAITPETGAIMLEAIQGEGGVRVPDEDYLPAVRRLCDERGLLLILDEVQTGMGRTGTLFCHEQSGIAPDIMTVAKALGNGMPIGAMGCTEKAALGFAPGTHATTFGGNPLCSAAALATLRVLLADGFLENVRDIAEYFMDALDGLASKHAVIKEVRGRGLMVGIELGGSVAPVVEKMLEAGIVCGPAGPKVLRFVPPLIVTKQDVDRVVSTLDRVLGDV